MITKDKIDSMRSQILNIMQEIDRRFVELVDLLTDIRAHPLDPPSEVRDRLVEGLSHDDSVHFKELTRAFCAASIVRTIWLGDSQATGFGTGYMAAYRSELEALRASGGEIKATLDQLARMATALERAERRERARKAMSHATTRGHGTERA